MKVNYRVKRTEIMTRIDQVRIVPVVFPED